MGDGHHAWASAEWILMIRNGFLREEGDSLVLGSGLLPEWLNQSQPLPFGPAPTEFGQVSVTFTPRDREVEAEWRGDWRIAPPRIEVRLPGFQPVAAGNRERSVRVSRVGAS